MHRRRLGRLFLRNTVFALSKKTASFTLAVFLLTQPLVHVFADEQIAVTEQQTSLAGGATGVVANSQTETVLLQSGEVKALVPDATKTKKATDSTVGDSEISVSDGVETIGDEPPITQSLAMGSGEAGSESQGMSNTRSFVTDLLLVSPLDGSLSFEYPLSFPPGRNDRTPAIHLSYNSAAVSEFDWVGFGWSIDIPFIKRLNKHGVENLYVSTSSTFYSSFSSELVQVGSTTEYRPKVDAGSFLKYVYTNNVWMATDKQGLVYTFGSTTNARKDNASSTSEVYAWMVSEIRDTNDNYIKYSYHKEAGQIYPDTIVYTGSGTTDGPFEIRFVRETRDDLTRSHVSKFPIDTTYRVDKIQTFISGTKVHEYNLSYSAANNDRRSLLKTITEIGLNSAASSTLPDTSFTYSTSSNAWVQASTTVPAPFVRNNTYSAGSYLADVNGDALLDIVQSYEEAGAGGSTQQGVYLNTGADWIASSTFIVPELFYENGEDKGFNLVDVNGDGLADLLQSFKILGSPATEYKNVYINDGDSWNLDMSWIIPEIFQEGPYDLGARLADANGDGLTDILMYRTDHNGSTLVNKVYLNTGSGWSLNASWVLPEPFIYSNTSDSGARLADVNGDGLTDILIFRTDHNGSTLANKVYFNTGSGWTQDTSWTIPVPFVYENSIDSGSRLGDVNGDGLVDILIYRTDHYGSTVINKVYLHRGNGWTEDLTYSIPVPFVRENAHDSGARLADTNGDGVTDILVSRKDHYDAYLENTVYIGSGMVSDMLATATDKRGGEVHFEYKGSPEYRLSTSSVANPHLPMLLQTVATTTYKPIVGESWTDTYSYKDGDFYFSSSSPRDRKFAGFGAVEKNSGLSRSVTYQHQGNGNSTSSNESGDAIARIGLSYRVDLFDRTNNLYNIQWTNWLEADRGDNATFVSPLSEVVLSYDGDGDHRDLAKSFTYDSYGNTTSITEWGSVDASMDGTYVDSDTDKRTVAYTYATNTTAYIVGLPSSQRLLNYAATKIKEDRLYYDNQSLGNVTDGNLTKRESWVSGSTYIDEEKTYNSYGLVTQYKDARDKATSYTYDALNLYPATTTNPLGYTTIQTYDYSSGKVSTSTDPNGRTSVIVYDAFDRPKEEKIPDPQTGTPVTKTTYTYTDTQGAVSVNTRSYLNTATTTDTYEYADGFGRKMQTRVEAEDSNQYAVRDLVYGNNGLLEKESLPYFDTGSARTASTSQSNLYTTYVYDALGRMATSTTAVGTTATVYDQWSETVFDPIGNKKMFSYDAFGRLSTTTEYNSTSTYATAYLWTTNDNLATITDALGNVRAITYDGLSRRLTMQDLHAASDNTFGNWSFAYDAAGNVATTTDPKGQVIVRTYDDLNRPLTENYTGGTGTEITYTYDTCTNGKMQLCQAVSLGAATTSYAYTPNSLPDFATTTIATSTFVISYDYDRQGQQTEIVFPDLSRVAYIYNSAGQLEKVQQKESGGSWQSLISDIDYAPTGLVVYEQRGNGASTTKTYDANALYRLSSIVTSVPPPTGGGGDELRGVEAALLADATETMGAVEMENEAVHTTDAPDFEDLMQVLENSLTDAESPSIAVPTTTPEVLDATTTDTVLHEDTANEIATTTTVQRDLLGTTTATTTDSALEPVLKEEILFIPDGLSQKTPRETARTYQFISDADTRFDTYTAHVDKSLPEVRLNTWSGAVDLSVRYELPFAVPYYSPLRNVVEWDGGSESVEAYPLAPREGMEAGGFEIEVVLDEKPQKNTFTFTLSGTDDLDFLYQPPLTEETFEEKLSCTETACTDAEGVVVVRRPENIVGSYAVYHKEKKDGEFKSGKVFHIFRPKIVDAKGVAVWGSLSYEKGALRVIVPQEYLDTATYPVRVDPTFGYGTIGGTNADTWNYIGSKFSMNSENGTLSKITAYTKKTTAGTMNKIAALYSDSSGAPNAPLATSSVTGGVGTTASWVDMTMPSYSLASGTTYWLWQGHDSSATVYWDTGSTNQYALKSITYPDWSNPITSPTYFARKVSIYATYTASATNSAPTAPSSLLAEGQTNPTSVTDGTPEFSAIFNDSNATDTAASYQIQVSTSSAFTSSYWDSTKTTLSSTTAQGGRSPDIAYAGSALASSTTFYWRIKFWDIWNAEGAWSTTTSTFVLASSTGSGTSTTLTYPYYAATVQNLSYTYDAVGNITQIVDRSDTHGAATTTYTYDDLYRLTSASTTGASSTPYTQTYVYNAIGNITSKSDVGAYTYSGNTGSNYANPHAATSINGVTYAYDTNGNLASTSAGLANTWNYQNRLTQSVSSGTTVTYAYDHTGQRTQKTGPSGTTFYPSNLYEYGSSATKHIYAGDTLIASVSGTGGSASTYHTHLDHLGSTQAQTDTDGYLTTLLAYYPFGSQRLDEGGGDTTTSSYLYADSLTSPWTDGGSWSVTLSNATTPVSAGTHSLKAQYTSPWGGISYTHPSSFNTTPYSTLSFWLYMGTNTGELDIYFTNHLGQVIQNRVIEDYLPLGFETNTWQQVSIPLSDLGISAYNNTLALNIESATTQTVYLDEIRFVGTTTSSSFTQTNRYTGHQYDEETSLTYMGARYYDGSTGRFTAQDPVSQQSPETFLYDPQQFNYYAYSRNNPLRFIDPLGLFNVDSGEIEKGDTLTHIQKQINEKYGTSLGISQIAKANGINNPDKIKAGNYIILPGQNLELNFDNKTLSAYDTSYGIAMPGLSWEGVSGNSGNDPIPEGIWSADPNKTQNWADVSGARKAGSLVSGITQNIPLIGGKIGPWPGGPAAWGTQRTELSNSSGDTGYYIHGGWTAGSAGCIDLTSNNNSFHKWFNNTWNKPINVNVDY